MIQLNYDPIHPSWQSDIQQACRLLSPEYLKALQANMDWLPGHDRLFCAFSVPKSQVRYVLLGESPYPRAQSANGYAFWDNAVDRLWSSTGFSTAVNRATSLRHFLKMLLVADGQLSPSDVSQTAIANLDKEGMIDTLDALFEQLLKMGFLLLNATPVLSQQSVANEAKQWQPFLRHVLRVLSELPAPPRLLLFGNIAKKIETVSSQSTLEIITAEHPYNLSFIQNLTLHQLFKPLRLLSKKT